MTFGGFTLLIALLALPLRADLTVDLTAAPGTLLHTDDELVYRFDIQGYERNAPAFGAPLYPKGIQFLFVSALQGLGQPFTVALESADGAYTLPLGGLSFSQGVFQGAGYSGTVATLSSSLTLSPEASNGLFGNSSLALLRLHNLGGPVTVGLPGYSLGQDLFISLGDGAFSTGAYVVSVQGPALPAPIPEPAFGWLLLGGAALVFMGRLAGRSKPISAARIE